MDNLKPCPFCGSAAKMMKHSPREFWVECSKAGCEAGSGGVYRTSQAAAEWWNRRQTEREHDEAVREGEASEQEGYGPVALSAIKFIEQLPAEVRGKRGDTVLRGLRQLAARACGGHRG
jgi:hypothetical protein